MVAAGSRQRTHIHLDDGGLGLSGALRRILQCMLVKAVLQGAGCVCDQSHMRAGLMYTSI